MKKKLLLTLLAACTFAAATAQSVVKVGKGSYASYTPLEMCYSEYHTPGDYGFRGDQSQYMQYRKLYLREKEGQPIPTNDWWTNLITQPYSGRMWAYPQIVQAQPYGIDVQAPSYWLDNGTEMKSNTLVSVKAEGFAPKEAVAESWHDWDVEFSMEDGGLRMYATMAHGMPFTWIEMRGLSPRISIGRSGQTSQEFAAANPTAEVLTAEGSALSGTVTGVNAFVLKMGDDTYGVYLPEGCTLEADGGAVSVTFGEGRQFVVVGVLPEAGALTAMAEYAYSVPRDTQVKWHYAASEGKMKTHWDVLAEDLRTGLRTEAVLQGFLPHQYRGTGNACTHPFTGTTYATPHGKLRMAPGNSLKIDYNFYGMLPYYALPADLDTDKNAFSEERMTEMLRAYASTCGFGADTYWGGKSLTQLALYMMFAREMGNTELFEQCRDKLKGAFVNWLTYTPGEKNYFFARYDRWGAMVGYSTSYDSDTFNDHHFHYGYFTYAAALLAMVDDDFRNNYGDMITLVAKDYANWDRTDTRFPLFRTFDPWAGHSFAGGMGDDNGNGQESSSEAMQSWGGLYLLGVALGNDQMRDAGIFGWLSEARGTAEYWFDRHDDPATGAEGYHTTDDEYNIKHTKFLDDEGKPHPYNSNLTCHGVGFWTYFGYDAIFMQGIQWMPISPALDYLSEDKAFAAWDYKRMWEDRRIGGWFKADETKDGYLGNSGGWGNVALSYLQRSDPAEAARIFDACWDAGEPEFRTFETNGITYFVTHSHLTYGDIDWSIFASIPTARVYVKDGVKTYMAYNPGREPISVTFSDGGRLDNVQPRRLAVSGAVSRDNTTITPDADVPADPREELEMVNLALGKTVTASGEENGGTLASNAVDGDDATRWASLKEDEQWIKLDLGKAARIYKMRLHWETAYAPEYDVLISTDGNAWTKAQTVTSDGGWDDIMMGDTEARYVQLVCHKRLAESWGYSIYEWQVLGCFTDAAATDLLGVKLTADDDVLKQYEPTQLHIKGYTCGGQWTDVTASWSTTQGKVSTTGEFTPDVYPRATVRATVGTTTVEKTFPVEEAIFVGYLTLSPKDAQVPEGDALAYEVTTLNQFKGPMEADPADITWEVGDADFAPTTGVSFDDATASLTALETGNYKVRAASGVAADTASVHVVLFSDLNLALGKPATATSAENQDMDAAKAVDGKMNTRWGSAWSGLSPEECDAQELTVDLQGIYMINRVKVFWEAARAKEWELQVSDDGEHWTTVHRTAEAPQNEDITFDETPAQYVRIHGISRNMGYGYSVYEFEVYGTRYIAPPVGITLPDAAPAAATRAFTIDGRRISLPAAAPLRQGLYIINGQKVLVK